MSLETMLPSTMSGVLILSLLCLSLFTLSKANSPFSPEFSYKDHPFYTHPHRDFLFTDPPESPVIMNRYYRLVGDQQDTSGCIFRPVSASLKRRLNTTAPLEDFATSVDSMNIARGNPRRVKDNEKYFHATFHSAVRIVLLMKGRGRTLERAFSNASENNLPSEWSEVFLAHAFFWKGKPLARPEEFLAVERIIPAGQTLVLPFAASITVAGIPVHFYHIIIADASKPSGTLLPFKYPSLPATVRSTTKGSVITNPEIPVPNTRCPTWLHDAYSTPPRDPADKGGADGAPQNWLSWHPAIDPVYWCYFFHEHGAWPGRWYAPQFGYTAWHTGSGSTSNGRQSESHNGFKVFSMQLPSDERKRAVVFTVHMHLSKARRFFARHHTVIVAVLEPAVDGEWEIEMELHMKMDFGATTTKMRQVSPGSGQMPIGEGQKEILEILKAEKNEFRARRINVMNNAMFRFGYEAWDGPLNTCSGGRGGNRRLDHGLSFDIRNPATAIPYMKNASVPIPDSGLEQFSLRRRDSVDKRVHSRTFYIGVEHCKDGFREAVAEAQKSNGGEFYTDSYFEEVMDGSGKFNLRQFVKNGFKMVTIPPGSYTPVSGWVGEMSLVPKLPGNLRLLLAQRRFKNMENAVDAMEN